MPNYILAQESNRANIPDTLWYAMEETDLDDIAENESPSLGDKVYVIKAAKMFIFGEDGEWYPTGLGGGGGGGGSGEDVYWLSAWPGEQSSEVVVAKGLVEPSESYTPVDVNELLDKVQSGVICKMIYFPFTTTAAVLDLRLVGNNVVFSGTFAVGGEILNVSIVYEHDWNVSMSEIGGGGSGGDGIFWITLAKPSPSTPTYTAYKGYNKVSEPLDEEEFVSAWDSGKDIKIFNEENLGIYTRTTDGNVAGALLFVGTDENNCLSAIGAWWDDGDSHYLWGDVPVGNYVLNVLTTKTQTSSAEVYTLDKTYAQVEDFFLRGIPVIITMDRSVEGVNTEVYNMKVSGCYQNVGDGVSSYVVVAPCQGTHDLQHPNSINNIAFISNSADGYPSALNSVIM